MLLRISANTSYLVRVLVKVGLGHDQPRPIVHADEEPLPPGAERGEQLLELRRRRRLAVRHQPLRLRLHPAHTRRHPLHTRPERLVLAPGQLGLVEVARQPEQRAEGGLHAGDEAEQLAALGLQLLQLQRLAQPPLLPRGQLVQLPLPLAQVLDKGVDALLGAQRVALVAARTLAQACVVVINKE